MVCQSALAHQPIIVESEITEIKKPDVSQAFYGNLQGRADIYKLRLDEQQTIYFSLLVPDLEGIATDVSLQITKDGKEVRVLSGEGFNWKKFYEEFAGDHYLQGPEEKITLEKGEYSLEVSSPSNRGKYVLVIGEKEEFPLSEIINTIKTLPRLKRDFFEKSAWGAFFNRIGLFVFGPVIIFVLIMASLIALIYIKKKKKKMKMPTKPE